MILSIQVLRKHLSASGYHPDSMAFLRPLFGATGSLLSGVVVMSKPKGQKPQAALAGGYEHPAFAIS